MRRCRTGLSVAATGFGAHTPLRRGRFNRHVDEVTQQHNHTGSGSDDPYELVLLTTWYRQNLGQCLRDLEAGHRHFPWLMTLMPCGPHIEGGLEVGSPGSRRHCLRDTDDPTSARQACRAFLEFPPVEGVHLRRDYRRLAESVEANIVLSDRKPVGRVGVTECKKLIASLDLFLNVGNEPSSSGVPGEQVAPEVSAGCARVLPHLARKWPLPPNAVYTDGNKWLQLPAVTNG